MSSLKYSIQYNNITIDQISSKSIRQTAQLTIGTSYLIFRHLFRYCQVLRHLLRLHRWGEDPC
jgi:hypothetical protein